MEIIILTEELKEPNPTKNDIQKTIDSLKNLIHYGTDAYIQNDNIRQSINILEALQAALPEHYNS